MNRQSLPPEARKYWDSTEEALGERIEAFGMARCESGCAPNRENLWGLLFFSSQALYFRHFPQDSMFRTLIRAARPGQKREDEAIFLRIEYIAVREVEVVRDPRFLKRFFRGAEYRLVVHHDPTASPAVAPRWTGDEMPPPSSRGAMDTLSIVVEQNADDILDFVRHNDAFLPIMKERYAKLD